MLTLLMVALAEETVPFELKEGRIHVRVVVNDKGPFAFVWDTGSPDTVLHPAIGIAGGEARFALGKASATVRAVVREAAGADGVLGYGFLSQFVTTLDYRSRTIRLVPAGEPWIGVAPRELGADEANEIGVDGGVVVHKVAKDSPAEKGGLREKDLVQEIDGRRVLRIDDYFSILRKARPGDVLVFRVVREKKDVELRVSVGRK